MLIECPLCHARATLPDSKEGAKVRCGGCGRIYVARAGGSRSASSRGPNRTPWIVGGGVALALVALTLFLRQSRMESEAVAKTPPPAPRPAPAPEPEPAETLSDWDLEVVQAAVRIHEAAAAGDVGAVAAGLHGPGAWATKELSAELEDPAAALAADPLHSARAAAFAALDETQRRERLASLAAEVVGASDADGELVSGWRPYDVEGLEVSDQEASFLLAVTPRDAARAGEKRFVEWRMVKEDGAWKAWSWHRHVDQKEIEARLRTGTERVTLSDGIQVVERDPEPLGHLDTTPPELRDLIDAALATMVDLSLTRESSAAKRRLVEIGRPAIPILLTALYENPLETQDQAIQANMVVQCLREITGQHFGYRPVVGDGVLATTEERQSSSIRQWFAWWYKHELTFEEKQVGDGLEEHIKLSEDDLRWLKRHQKKN